MSAPVDDTNSGKLRAGIGNASQESRAGVYFSANDRIYDWTVAFLESLRTFSPNLQVALIPFNDQCKKVLSLQKRFNFTVLEHESFPVLESIGRSLERGQTPYSPYWFRRLASFWGPFDEFIYLDARVLVLTDLAPLIAAPRITGFDLLHYDRALDQVYQPGPLRTNILRNVRATGFISGAWAARRGLLALEELVQIAKECVEYRDQLNERNTDQFFLNYCCDIRKFRIGHFAEVLGDMCQNAWARQPGYVFKAADAYRRWDHGGLDHGKKVSVLHWGGVQLSAAMPEAEMFYRFRDARLPFPQAVLRRIGRSATRIPLRIIDLARRNRRINEAWHRLRR